ncbi:MAG: hypothetical protein ABI747_02360 [Candidatus Moraniibacteriota bacterium]
MFQKSLTKGIAATVALLTLYFSVVSFISGWAFTQEQWRTFWYYLLFLALGFGIQIGLYTYLKALHCSKMPKGTLATTSTTSTFAMLSCCTHYLVSVIPLLGVTGAVAVIDRYQEEFFQVGLVFSLVGILSLFQKTQKLRHAYEPL